MTWPPQPGTRFARILSIFLIFSLFLPACLGFASTLPSFTRLPPISAQVQAPTGLALDRKGRLYIVETTSNRVTIFSQSGKFLHAITNLQEPISVAVAANGTIYIGNKKAGNVAVYNSNYSLLFKLGRGDGEFAFPCAIAVDNISHKIYVADRAGSAVKAYNPNGSFNTSLGQPGNGDGQFHEPVSIAIDPITAELIVLDLQQKQDTFYGTLINGARIQYFDLNGNFLRGYSKSGYKLDAGELPRPIHIAIDNTSRLYVTDALWQKVLVYDNNNTFLGQISDPKNPLHLPLGIRIGATNRLYISSFLGGKIEVYGIDEYSAMDVSPTALSFKTVEGGANPPPQSTTISNTGKASFNWIASSQESGLILADTSGLLLAPGSRSLDVTMDAQGLAPGIYTNTLDITIDGTDAGETVRVALTVLENPLQIRPKALTFNAEIKTTPAGQTLSISTGSINPVNWTATADQGWLAVSKPSGTTPEDLRIYAATENLTAGTYTGTVTFSNQQGDPAPVTVAVTLNLTDPGTTPIEPPDPTSPGHDDKNMKWTVTQVLPGTSLNGVWGSPKNVYVVGAAGTILHKNGNKWKAMDSGSTHGLYSVWGSSDDDIYAVGDNGLVLHYTGKNWAPVAAATGETLRDVIGTKTDVLAVSTYGSILNETLAKTTESGIALRSIWGSSNADIFVTGEAGAVLHYDGTRWNTMVSGTDQWLNSVWGSSASDVFAVGENGVIIHYDGSTWSRMDSGTDEMLLSVWGASGSDVFAVGADGLILHYNGKAWFPVTSEAAVTLNDVWVSSKSEVYAVGEDGIIISGKSRFQWMHFITNIILVNASSNNDDDDTKTEKGPIPTKIVEGKE